MDTWGQTFLIDSYNLGKIMVLNLHENTVNGSLYNATIINKTIKKIENKKETDNSRPYSVGFIIGFIIIFLALFHFPSSLVLLFRF